MLRDVSIGFVSLVSLCTAATGEVIFSNFGPGDSFVGNAGTNVANGVDFGVYLESAAGFTVKGGPYTLETIEVGIGMLWGENIVFVTIHDDAAGEPGKVLGTVTVVDQMENLGTDPNVYPPPVVATFEGSIELSDGQQYWVSLASDPKDHSWLVWNTNNIGDEGPVASRSDGGEWNTIHLIRPVFRVSGSGAGILGDLNGDGVVDVFDLLILLGDWGACDDPGDCAADLNGDDVVDVFDLLILLSNWG